MVLVAIAGWIFTRSLLLTGIAFLTYRSLIDIKKFLMNTVYF
jgi:hypothetical protein